MWSKNVTHSTVKYSQLFTNVIFGHMDLTLYFESSKIYVKMWCEVFGFCFITYQELEYGEDLDWVYLKGYMFWLLQVEVWFQSMGQFLWLLYCYMSLLCLSFYFTVH
jgi:hypothetical protein